MTGGWGVDERGENYWMILNSWGNAYDGKFTLYQGNYSVTFSEHEESRGFLRIAMDPLLEMDNLSYVIKPITKIASGKRYKAST